MRPWINLRQTRQIATLMLFVWLFAMVASGVNACLLQPSGAEQVLGDRHQRSEPLAHRGPSDEGHAGASGSHAPAPAQAACASFCDTEQSIVAKAQPSKGDGALDLTVVPVPRIEHGPAFTPARAQARWRPLAAPPPAPPVSIAFLRLTL